MGVVGVDIGLYIVVELASSPIYSGTVQYLHYVMSAPPSTINPTPPGLNP
jgi:hypothetical protein